MIKLSGLGSKIFAKLVSLRGDKKMFADKATFEKLCEDSKNQHSQPFEMNFSKFTSSVSKQEIDGMLYYILKPKEIFSNDKAMFFHGGAYILEITPEHWKMIDNIASQSGIEMWVPVYPLAPNNTFDESFKPVKKLYEKFITEGEGKRILMGDSAGGGYSLVLAQYAKEQNIRIPDILILISPWLDVTMKNPLIEKINTSDVLLDPYGLRICGEMWAGNRETCDPVISPVYGDLDIPCKIYVFTGTNDIINADAKEFLKATKKIGKTIEYNEVEGLQHDFVMWPIPEARNAVKKICSVLR